MTDPNDVTLARIRAIHQQSRAELARILQEFHVGADYDGNLSIDHDARTYVPTPPNPNSRLVGEAFPCQGASIDVEIPFPGPTLLDLVAMAMEHKGQCKRYE